MRDPIEQTAVRRRVVPAIAAVSRVAANLNWILVTVLVLVGCGGGKQPTYRAGGNVRFTDGTPLTAGWVSFRSLDDEKHVAATGNVKFDGTFELTTFSPGDGAVAGRHQALVMAPVFRNERETLPYEPTKLPAPLVDRQYSNFETSGLEFVVTTNPTENQFAIQVTPPKQARQPR